ncbi:ABC transporter permease [Dermacoccaceae bacterium W4C1]
MILSDVWSWLTDGANWSGSEGIPTRILEHLWYTGLTLAIAALIAIPLGVWIAHSGKGKWLVTAANALRAVPSLGLLFILSMLLGSRLSGDLAFVAPSIIALVVMAIPPILAGAYSGVSEVDPAARDAARGMGMTGTEVLRKVELPCALPLLFSGLRSATLQVVATATIAAYPGLGGLGRYIIDGLALSDYAQMIAGSILVAVLALLLDLVWSLVQAACVSPGLGGRRRRGRADATLATAGADSGPTDDTDLTDPQTREQVSA